MKKERLLEDLEEYSKLEENWDGYGGYVIHKNAILNSSIFIKRFYDNTEYLSPCPSGELFFELIPIDSQSHFVILINEDSFSWAFILNPDIEKSIEIHNIPMDFNEIEKLVKEYSILSNNLTK